MEPSLHRKASPSQPAIPPLRPEQGVLAANPFVVTNEKARARAAIRETRVTKMTLKKVAGCYQCLRWAGSLPLIGFMKIV